ncbi:MAG: elongation factor P [Candidatus Marinimicrobia bacterium]|nr:elongation factor P [Candidatus Neomarinimicrobiota bacterium]
MISVTELKSGTTFKLNGQPHVVLTYKHTKLGRGAANIKVKARNLATGKVVEKVFISGAKVEPMETVVEKLQFLYQDGENYFFMNPQSFEQVSLNQTVVGTAGRYLKEGSQVKVLFFKEVPLSIELPKSMVFTVVESPPGVKGDSATAASKPVTLENGLIVQVPLFIKKGDRVKIDTRSGEYKERVSN